MSLSAFSAGALTKAGTRRLSPQEAKDARNAGKAAAQAARARFGDALGASVLGARDVVKDASGRARAGQVSGFRLANFGTAGSKAGRIPQLRYSPRRAPKTATIGDVAVVAEAVREGLISKQAALDCLGLNSTIKGVARKQRVYKTDAKTLAGRQKGIDALAKYRAAHPVMPMMDEKHIAARAAAKAYRAKRQAEQMTINPFY